MIIKYSIRTFVILVFLAVTWTSNAQNQNVTIQILNKAPLQSLSWQILDKNDLIVVSGDMFEPEETSIFLLDKENHYKLNISTDSSYTEIFELLSLSVNSIGIITILSGIEPGDYSFPFYTSDLNSPKKIIGGSDAAISDFPWQVFFRAASFICGGSIISENWVLTAAHCVFDDEENPIDISNMSIKVGAINPYSATQGKTYMIEEVIVHESYDNEIFENDIAVLKISEAIDFENAEAIELVTVQDSIEGYTDPGVLATVTGWGLTNVDPKTFAQILQKIQIPIVSNETAAAVWGETPSSMLMAGTIGGGKDACNGDSGGPLVVPVGDSFKLAGIVSWGNTNCNTFGGYTRVTSYYDWIRLKTGVNDIYRPEVPQGDNIICEGDFEKSYSTSLEPLASGYEWKLSPAEAGDLSFNKNIATVNWDSEYLGEALLEVRNTVNDQKSGWAELDIDLAPNTVLTSQTGDITLCEGESLDMSVIASGHNITYDWYWDDQLIKSGPTNRIIYPNPLSLNSGVYRVDVNGGCGTISSDDINVTIHPLTEILSESNIQTVSYGNPASIEITAEGHDLQYKWYQNDVELVTETLPIINYPAVDATGSGTYRVVVSGTCGEETSRNMYLFTSKNASSSNEISNVWPQLSNGTVNIALRDAREYNIRIYNLSGLLLDEITNRKYQTLIDLSKYSDTMFIIQLYGKEIDEVYRVVLIANK